MTAAGWVRIVNVSSVAGSAARPQLVHYSAAKAGLIASPSLRPRSGPLGITVNAIAPGLIDTPLLSAGVGLAGCADPGHRARTDQAVARRDIGRRAPTWSLRGRATRPARC